MPTIEVEHYSTVPLFKDLPPQEIMRLLKIAQDVPAKTGDVIVKEGEPGDGFFVIGAGEFEVRKKRGDAPDDTVLARLGEFSFFGEMSLVTYAPRAATVVCSADGRLKKFPTSAFEKLLDHGDLAAYKVVRNMCRILAERLARLGERFVAGNKQ
jgi:CRP-like cAMP-binding protein